MPMYKPKQKICNEVIGMMEILPLSVLYNSLLTICKSFACLDLDYEDIAYDIQSDLNLERKPI